MSSKIYLCIAAAILISLPNVIQQNEANAGGWHKRAIKVCANRLVNEPEWQSGHYAFAISSDRIHCGWAFNRDSRNHAYQTALRACKQRAHTPCKVMYAK